MKKSTIYLNTQLERSYFSGPNKKNNLTKYFSSILILFIILTNKLEAQESQKFNIVYVASESWALNLDWLQSIKNCGATGVCIRIIWGDKESTKNDINWYSLDQAINTVTNNQLNVYIRVSMGVKKPTWIRPNSTTSIPFDTTDFQITSNGKLYSHELGDTLKNHPLNFASARSVSHMLEFYKKVVDHIKIKSDSLKLHSCPYKIVEVVPSVSPDEEMEFPNKNLCGYSQIEINLFQNFLRTKYSTISDLKVRWGNDVNFNLQSFESVNPRNYNWDSTPSNYHFTAGRLDWMLWRTSLLKSFIDKCAKIAHDDSLKIGLQLGSIYDNSIDKRFGYDVVPLLENVDALRVADIIQYQPDFLFGADFARSVCKYWGFIKNKIIDFSTESNGPDFQSFPSQNLCLDWDKQLNAYYLKGSDAHFIFGWDNSSMSLMYSTFSAWKSSLNNLKNKNKINFNSNIAVHLGCEEGNYEGLANINQSNSYHVQSYFSNSMIPTGDYTNFNIDKYKNSIGFDVVTNFMISNSSTYLRDNYQILFLTKSSKYISDLAYKNLLRKDLTIKFDNATYYTANLPRKFFVTAGIRNEYNEKRSPIHLIWRSRQDLMDIFPTGNFPDPIKGPQMNWHAEKNYDLVFWAVSYGVNEYPEWVLLDSNNKFIYDPNIRNVWNIRPDLRSVFSDGHYTGDHTWNLLDWAIRYGATQYENYIVPANYINWPYIGTPTSQIARVASRLNSISSIDNTLGQLKNLKIFPNIVKQGDNIFIQVNSIDKEINFKIVDISGKVLTKSVLRNNEELKINTSNFIKGIYIFIVDGDGQKPYKVIVD